MYASLLASTASKVTVPVALSNFADLEFIINSTSFPINSGKTTVFLMLKKAYWVLLAKRSFSLASIISPSTANFFNASATSASLKLPAARLYATELRNERTVSASE